MASAVIDTRGMSSTSHNGYVSFSGGSSGSSKTIYQHSPGGAVPLGSPSNLVSNAKSLKEDKVLNDFYTGNTANNGLSLSDFNNTLKTILEANQSSKGENLQNARDNAQMQYYMNAGLMRLQHSLNENSAEKVMHFNAVESEKNRQFQERLANTAHVREIEDLKAAGLNPVLTGLGGQGAYTPAGSEAQGHNAQTGLGQVSSIPVDMTNNATILSSMFNNFLTNVNERFMQLTRNETNLTMQDMENYVNQAINDAKNKTSTTNTVISGLLGLGGSIIHGIASGKAIGNSIKNFNKGFNYGKNFGANALAGLMIPKAVLNAATRNKWNWDGKL